MGTVWRWFHSVTLVCLDIFCTLYVELFYLFKSTLFQSPSLMLPWVFTVHTCGVERSVLVTHTTCDEILAVCISIISYACHCLLVRSSKLSGHFSRHHLLRRCFYLVGTCLCQKWAVYNYHDLYLGIYLVLLVYVFLSCFSLYSFGIWFEVMWCHGLDLPFALSMVPTIQGVLELYINIRNVNWKCHFYFCE